MTALMLLSFVPTQLSAVTGTATTSVPLNKPVESAEAEVLLNRLEEINAMDKSELNAPEKKELREIGGGVYLSVGAVIIIILLLVLLL